MADNPYTPPVPPETNKPPVPPYTVPGGPIPYSYYYKPPKKRPVYSTAEQLLALFCLLLGYAFVRLVLFQHPGLGITLFAAFFLLTGIVFYKKNAVAFSAKSKWLLAASVLFCIPFFLFSDTVILIPCFFFWMLLTALWVTAVNGLQFANVFSAGAHALISLPLRGFGKGFAALGQLFKKLPAQKTVLKVILGLAVALPITAIVTLLLTQADTIFSNMMTHFSDSLSSLFFGNLFDSFWRIVCTIPVFLYIFGLLDSCFRKESYAATVQSTAPAKNTVLYRVSPLTLCVAATPLLLVYAAFFCAQAPYYFAAFRAYLPTEFTVADFARRGFFELCIVACINFAVLLALQLLAKQQSDGHTAIPIRIYSVLLSLFTLLLIATAIRKMLLYISCFGLTKLRVLTCWLMLLLAISFVLILLHQCISRMPVKKCITAVCIVFIGIACFGNFDGFIAKYNVTAYQAGDLENFDVSHLYSLSCDAVPYVVPLLQDKDTALSDQIKTYLISKQGDIRELTFPEYSLSHYRALKAIRESGIQ